MSITFENRQLVGSTKIKDTFNNLNLNNDEVEVDLKSLDGAIESISSADSNAQIGVYTISDTVNTDNYSDEITGLSLFNGLTMDLYIENNNTGPATLDINDGNGAKSIKLIQQGTKRDLLSDELTYGYNRLKYDGLDWIIISTDSEKIGNDFGIVNVKHFGAKGDGVNDDRQAIQDAIDYAQNNNKNVYFPTPDDYYAIKSTHDSYTNHCLIIDGSTNGFNMIGGNSFVKITLEVTANSLLYLPNQQRDLTMKNLFFDGNHNCDYVFNAFKESNPYMTLENIRFYNATVECASIESFVANFTKVVTAGATNGIGFRYDSQEANVPTTSTTFNNCYSLDCDIGYQIGLLNYSVFNACACDNCRLGYNFTAPFGVTMNSCGAEGVEKPLKVDGYQGFVINGFYTLSAGGDVGSPTDYLFEFGSGKNVTITGVQHQNPKEYDYLLGLTENSYGSENITILDRSIRKSESYWVTNYSFDKYPIKFIIDDSINKEIEEVVSTSQELVDALEFVNGKNFKRPYKIKLNDGEYTIDDDRIILENMRGENNLIIEGNTSNNEAVDINIGYNDLQFISNDIDVIFKDLRLSPSTSISSTQLINIDNSNVIFNNVEFVLTFSVGRILDLTNYSNVKLIDSYSVGSNVSDVSYSIESGSTIELNDRTSPPTTGEHIQGMKVYNSQPSAGGNIGWVCVTSGNPGTWKTFGTIEA